MCGIVTIFGYAPDAPPVDQGELLRIRERMRARGPDGCGIWVSEDGRVGLAHRRLSILDLSRAGAQPMATDNGALVITFNGEIYNCRELRDRLARKGYRFRSTSDTEVLLHLYAERGPDLVEELRGMYAFAIWDRSRRGLFLARDPFGIKPLYLSDDGRTVRVASQVKALLAGEGVDRGVEPAGHVGFFVWGHVPEPYTLYRGIRTFPAGGRLWIPQDPPGGAPGRPELFASIPRLLREAEAAPPALSGGELGSYLRETLLDSVRHHLVSDVPVGVFLSAGLDSSTLTALASEVASEPLHTVTLGFREYQGRHHDEVPQAEAVAKSYGCAHRTIWVGRDDFEGRRSHLLQEMDQPSIDGVNSYFVSLAVASVGLKVALSGVGGDEIFGSYPSFRQVPAMRDALRPFAALPGVGRGFRLVSAPVLKRFTSPKYAGLLEYGGSLGGAYLLRRGMFMPWELPELLDGELVRRGWEELSTVARLEESCRGVGSDHLAVSALEMQWYMRSQLLRDTDWASMAHSLEVRTPLVDLPTLKALAPLFAGGPRVSKLDMAKTPASPLPAEVLNRKKSGFAIPVREWLGGGAGRNLRSWARHIYRQLEG